MQNDMLEKLGSNTQALRDKQMELLATANAELKEKVDWVIDWYRSDVRTSLMSRWELGKEIAEILNDRDNGCKRYGSRALHTIAIFSGEAEASLRSYAKLANAYDKTHITDLSDRVMADGVTPLSYSHIRTALILDKAEDRDKAIDLAQQRCWTVDELAAYVRSMSVNRSIPNPNGRPIAKPKNVDGVINQQLSFADDFDKRNITVWKDPEYSLTNQLAKIKPEEYTEELAAKIGAVAYNMRHLAEEALQRASEAEQRYEDVRNELNKRTGEILKIALDEDPTAAIEQKVRREIVKRM